MFPKTGRSLQCKACKAAYAKARYAANPEGARSKVMAWRAANPDKHRAYQKGWYAANAEQQRIYRKAWNDANPDYHKKWNAANPGKRKEIDWRCQGIVGMTLERFEEIVRAQDGKCWICQKTPATALCVDHDHTTGMVRGLLCDRCNTALGGFRDDPELLERAAQYLRKNGKAEDNE